MSLRSKIFITFVLITALAGSSATYWVQREARDSYAHVVEEILVDLAQLFATQLQSEISQTQSLQTAVQTWSKNFESFKGREFSARILNVLKKRPSLEVYITDDKGIVIYSSRKQSEIGQDYSQWLDVSLTLQGKYGARATREDRGDKNTSSYYIGAPIYHSQKIVGVISVIKARTSISEILDYFFQQMLGGVLFAAALALLFGGLLFTWITWPVENLKKYALQIASGQKAVRPSMPHSELRQLSDAFETMRVSLEDRRVIERFIQSLTHELKSPLAAMRGSAELTLEPMEDLQRRRFLQNIIDESRRAEVVLEELLAIAALESQTGLKKIESVSVVKTLEQAQTALMALFEKHKVLFEKSYAEDIVIRGDSFLLFQAFRNIFQNAVEFTDAGGLVKSRITVNDDFVTITISDNGAGIPDFAQDRIFEKFYSLERPRTGKRGSGLGLSFVQEVVQLHKGTISVKSCSFGTDKGTSVTVSLPLSL